MTQVDRSQEPRKEVRPGLTDNYTPAANVLIRGFSELSISERYVAIGLVSLYWDEKIHPVSLRELAAKIQIDHTALRSRGGKRPAEGILDKLWRLGIIGLMEGKPITETGNKGRVQTYITVNHSFIAECNRNCPTAKGTKTPRYITVGTTNNSNDKDSDVENTNENVGKDNHTVGSTNHDVENTNHTVVHSSVESPPKNSNNISNTSLRDEKKEDDCAIAPSLTPSFFALLPWLWSNDLETPSKLFVELTPTLSANEVQRRLWATEQYKQELIAKGCFVVVEMVSVPPQNAVDASALPDWLGAIVDANLSEAQTEISYSHNLPQTPSLEQNTENTGIGAGAGYKTNTDANTPPQEEKPPKGKGRGKKPKVEQPALLDTKSKAVAFSEDEQLRFDWYCQLPFIRVAPEHDVLRKKHSAALVPHVHSAEDMKDLADFTKKGLEQRGIKVYVVEMGNMTNSKNLNEWLASREQPANVVQFQQRHKGSPNAPLLDEEVIKERTARNIEEKKARIAAREAQKAAMA